MPWNMYVVTRSLLFLFMKRISCMKFWIIYKSYILKAVWLSCQTNGLRLVRHIQTQLELLPRISYCLIEVNHGNVNGSTSQFSCIQRFRVLVWQNISMNWTHEIIISKESYVLGGFLIPEKDFWQFGSHQWHPNTTLCYISWWRFHVSHIYK